jgi:uncharacterized membrane protein YcaP (DUF421 family)
MAELVELFRPEYPAWQMMLRGTVVYWFLLLVFRFVLRRDIGSMGVADLLFVVLVADASSNAMQGEYRTLGDGLALVGTMVAWNYALDWLAFRSDLFSRLLEAQPEVLIRRGRLNRRAMRRELITHNDLMEKLREQGVESVREVRIARLESDGNLSVFTFENAERRAGKAPDQDSKGRPGA